MTDRRRTVVVPFRTPERGRSPRRSGAGGDRRTWIARFWDLGEGTVTPPGQWNRIAQIVSRQQGLTLGENARLFALLNLAPADAAIVAWYCKNQIH